MFAHTLPLTRLHRLPSRPLLSDAVTHTIFSVHYQHTSSSFPQLVIVMSDQVVPPSGGNHNDQDTITATAIATSTATTTQPRRSQRLLDNQRGQPTTHGPLRAAPRQPRTSVTLRPLARAERRKRGQYSINSLIMLQPLCT